MHVAIVSPYDPRPSTLVDPLGVRGGVEEALDRCASGLARRGHDITVVTSSTRPSDVMDADGVRFVRVKRRGIVFRNPIASLHANVPRDADVVHVPATYPFVSDLIPMREARRGRPTVLDYHFDVHGTSLPMRVAAAMHAATLGRGMARATRVLTKSLDYAEHSPVLARVARERLDWVPNGIDINDFPLKRDDGADILCVGRLVPYKGVGVLLRAMPAIHRATGAHLTIVGDGPERARLEAMAPACAHFVGRLPREDLVQAYANARVTVLPSANAQEAFGITLLESMAAGTPVVASDLPGVREVARLAGLTAAPRDPEDLARAVIEAFERPRAFGSPAEVRARVHAAYGWARVLDRLECSYETALGAPGSSGRTPARTRKATGGGA